MRPGSCWVTPNTHLVKWDLGEFVQKEGRATRWGTIEELLHASSVAKMHGIGIIVDAVLNVIAISVSLSLY